MQLANPDSGLVLWFTGLPGSGKTTLGKMLHSRFLSLGIKTELLDGDQVRKELSPDLGFSKEDRETHARRVCYISKLLARNGVSSIVTLISPYRSSRQYARQEIGKQFVEVYASCSLQTCMKRDPKGLYKKAAAGEIKDLTGLQDTYEIPDSPEIPVDTEMQTPEQAMNVILHKLAELGYITC